MSDDELMEHVRKIRAHRRIRKTKKASPLTAEKRKEKLKMLLGELSPEEKKTLMEKLAK
jgi:2-oxo-4-hydroxy-4-carboxy--5-ureidoimidazoline (OHCU) decarboxylase